MSGQDEIREFFDEMAPGRDQTISSNPIIDYEQRVRSRAVLELLDPQPGERILDVGCGNGRDLPPLLEKGCRCVAIDYSPAMVDQTRRRLERLGARDVDVTVGDATSLRFADGEFDKVFASEVIEHIPRWHDAVREMVRVLKPGGVLVLTTPNRRSWYGFDRYVVLQALLRRKWNHPQDEWKTRGELKEALEAAGARPVRWVGVCYVPGFALTYRAPRPLQRLTVALTRPAERLARNVLTSRGYMIGVRALKPR